MTYITTTRWGELSFPKLEDAKAFSIGDIIINKNTKTHWYKNDNKWFLFMDYHPNKLSA